MARKSDADTIDSEQNQLQQTMDDLTHHSREIARHAGRYTQDALKKPTTKAAIVGAAAMGAVFTIGLVQTAIGGTAAYVAYHVLKKRKEDKEQEGEAEPA